MQQLQENSSRIHHRHDCLSQANPDARNKGAGRAKYRDCPLTFFLCKPKPSNEDRQAGAAKWGSPSPNRFSVAGGHDGKGRAKQAN